MWSRCRTYILLGDMNIQWGRLCDITYSGLRQADWSISIYSVKWGRLCDITCSGDWSISIYLNLGCVLLMGLNFQWPDRSNISSSDLQHHHNNNTLVHLSCTHLTAKRIATVYGALWLTVTAVNILRINSLAREIRGFKVLEAVPAH